MRTFLGQKENSINPCLKIAVLLWMAIFLFSCNRDPVWAESSPIIWKVLLAEAASEGYDGMMAVACVIRNRGGDLRGFAGAYRKDLDAFCNRQGKRYIKMAKRIETIVFKNNGQDITNGATHFENIEQFGIPKWTRNMIKTVKIKSHTFYREK